jgi:hypothetical protein
VNLLFIAAEEEGSDEAAFLQKVQDLKAQVSSDLVLNPQYVKAYFRTETKKLEKDMQNLKVGLQRYSEELAGRELPENECAFVAT